MSMVKVWDDRLKRLAGLVPKDFITWLLPGAHLIRPVSLELKTLTRTVSTDVLFEVRWHGKKVLVHIEFQRCANAKMGLRIWEYNVLATLAHNCPVYSFVIYLAPGGGEIPESLLVWEVPGCEPVHIFRYTAIKLWELPIEVLKRTGLKGLLPLWLLAKDGARREVVREVFAGVQDDREILALACSLASMVLTSESDQLWLEGEVGMLEDILRDTWFYQKILKQGLEEGREKGLKEGREKGLKEGLKEERQRELQRIGQSLITGVEVKFPSLVPLAKQCATTLKDPDALLKVTFQLFTVQDTEIARSYLLAALDG